MLKSWMELERLSESNKKKPDEDRDYEESLDWGEEK